MALLPACSAIGRVKSAVAKIHSLKEERSWLLVEVTSIQIDVAADEDLAAGNRDCYATYLVGVAAAAESFLT